MAEQRLRDLIDRLHAAYGPQGWWPGDGAFEVIVGAILTQRTAWRNAESAIGGLRAAGLMSVAAMDSAPVGRVAAAIRSAGFYNVKARRLKAFAAHVTAGHGGVLSRMLAAPTGRLRDELLALPGIGEETADAILVYAAGRPSAVVDAYTVRLLDRLGWMDGDPSYGALRQRWLDALPPDAAFLGEAHALIVRHGKEHCRVRPICPDCPIAAICPGAGDQAVRR